MTIVWLPSAVANRDELIDHIAKHDPKAAIEHDDRIEKQSDQLDTNPEMGRPGRKRGTRELVIGRTPFIVVYRVKQQGKRVEIWRVLHTSQAWPA